MIHLAWRPSSSEPREVFALWGKGGDLGFSSVCEASHNTHLFLSIYIHIEICAYVHVYPVCIYIYIYITTCVFLGGHLVCLVVYSFVFLGEAGAVEAAQELSKLGAVFNEARDELVSKILVVAEQVCNDNDLYVKCLHWPAHHNICPCKISAD